MKALSVIVLLAVGCCCFAQTDTNLIGAGMWSDPVRDAAVTLRGRLVLYDDHTPDAGNQARVYLELQHVSGPREPVELYYNPNMGVDGEPPGLLLGLRDAQGQEVPDKPIHTFTGPFNKPFWITLPGDSTIRIRTDYFAAGYTETNGLNIMGRPRWFTIPHPAKDDFYLYGTFISTNSHPSPLNYQIWQGTIDLPQVRIPARK